MNGGNVNVGRKNRRAEFRLLALVVGNLSGRLLLPLAFALLLAAALTPVLFISPDHFERNGAGSVRGEGPLHRLALVVLQSAGVIAPSPNYGEVILDQDEGESWIDTQEWVSMESPIANCARDRIVGALVAVESYARPEWRRRMEIAIARLVHDISGYFPDWSYGIGQIRLKTAQHAMHVAAARIEPVFGVDASRLPSDEELFDLLTDDCSNTRIAQLVLAEWKVPRTAEGAIEAAEAYRGGKADLVVPGVVTHERLVAQLATMILPYRGQGSLGVFDDDERLPEREEIEHKVKKWRFGVLEFPDATADGKWPVACLDGWPKSTAKLMVPKSGEEGSPWKNLELIAKSVAQTPLSNLLQSHYEVMLVHRPLQGVEPYRGGLVRNQKEPGEIQPYVTIQMLELLDELESLGIGTPGLWRGFSARESQQGDTCRTMVTISPKPTAFYDDIAAVLTHSK